MAFITADRVRETTTTTGTGTVTLGGAVTGYRSFGSVMANADTCAYCIYNAVDGTWEVGRGTYTSSGTTLSRDTVTSSSNAGALVNFAAGTKAVFLTMDLPIPVSTGGTGATSLAGHGAVVMNSGGTAQVVVAPSTAGKVFTSNGTDFISSLTYSSDILTKVAVANGSPADGNEWYDSTRKNLEFEIGTLLTVIDGSFFVQTATKNQNNTTTETTLFGTGLGSLTIPANFFVVGRTIRLSLSGFYQSAAGANWTIKVKLGSTVLASTGALASTTNASNKVWQLTAFITCYTTGATGNFWCEGLWIPVGSNLLGISSGAVVNVDTTASQVLDCTLQWGTAASGNTVTTTTALAEAAA